MQFQASLEHEIAVLLQKPTKLEELLSTVKTHFADRLVAVCDFLWFVIQCELFSEAKTAFAVTSLLKIAHEHSLNAFLGELLGWVSASKNNTYKVAAFSFLNEPKLTQVLGLEAEGLRAFLEKAPAAKKLPEVEKKIAAELAATPPLGPAPKKLPFFFDSQAPQFFDSPELFTDVARGYNAVLECCPESTEWDMLLPLPSVVEPSVDDLMTPFPFFLEAPLFSPDFPQAQTAAHILKNMKKATDYDIDAT